MSVDGIRPEVSWPTGQPTRLAPLSDIADLQAEHSKVFEESLEELGFTVRKCTQVAELSAVR
jgi:hypothetical protein